MFNLLSLQHLSPLLPVQFGLKFLGHYLLQHLLLVSVIHCQYNFLVIGGDKFILEQNFASFSLPDLSETLADLRLTSYGLPDVSTDCSGWILAVFLFFIRSILKTRFLLLKPYRFLLFSCSFSLDVDLLYTTGA